MRPGPKVDELNLGSRDIDENVLVLDVPVDDSPLMAGDDRLQHLLQEAPCHDLLKSSLLGDEVKEVLAAERALQDQDVGVGTLVKVEQANHARDARDFPQEADFERDALAVVLK